MCRKNSLWNSWTRNSYLGSFGISWALLGFPDLDVLFILFWRTFIWAYIKDDVHNAYNRTIRYCTGTVQYCDTFTVHSAYVEQLNNNYTPVELKQAEDISSGAIEVSEVLEFLNLTPGRSFIVKLIAVDTADNTTSREEYVQIDDMTASVINQS